MNDASGLDAKLDRAVARHAELEHLLNAGAGADPAGFARLSQEYSELSSVVDAVAELRRLRSDLDAARALAADADEDADMRALAEAEAEDLAARLPDREQALKLLLLPKDTADAKNAILEIRAGTGGDEAALFAGDLLRMYQRHAQQQGWRLEMLDLSEPEIGGVKEAICSVTGTGVFARLKFESGTHRVQRVPVTESGGRIHTSAATVAVLPEAEEVDVDVAETDLRIDTYRSQGAGGQHVNTTDSAVRITHLPSGIVVTCQDNKSQHRNKAQALTVLRARLLDRERSEADAARAESRRLQVGSGDRSERVRTYNFPQGRVTDHRIGLTLHKLQKILDGEALDEVIDALVAEDQAARLAGDVG